jgi:hypothetical protein
MFCGSNSREIREAGVKDQTCFGEQKWWWGGGGGSTAGHETERAKKKVAAGEAERAGRGCREREDVLQAALLQYGPSYETVFLEGRGTESDFPKGRKDRRTWSAAAFPTKKLKPRSKTRRKYRLCTPLPPSPVPKGRGGDASWIGRARASDKTKQKQSPRKTSPDRPRPSILCSSGVHSQNATTNRPKTNSAPPAAQKTQIILLLALLPLPSRPRPAAKRARCLPPSTSAEDLSLCRANNLRCTRHRHPTIIRSGNSAHTRTGGGFRMSPRLGSPRPRLQTARTPVAAMSASRFADYSHHDARLGPSTWRRSRRSSPCAILLASWALRLPGLT